IKFTPFGQYGHHSAGINSLVRREFRIARIVWPERHLVGGFTSEQYYGGRTGKEYAPRGHLRCAESRTPQFLNHRIVWIEIVPHVALRVNARLCQRGAARILYTFAMIAVCPLDDSLSHSIGKSSVCV